MTWKQILACSLISVVTTPIGGMIAAAIFIYQNNQNQNRIDQQWRDHQNNTPDTGRYWHDTPKTTKSNDGRDFRNPSI